MKKQKRQLVVLLILLVLAIGAWQGLKAYNIKQEEKEAAASTVDILSVATDEITSLTVNNGNGSYQLNYDGSTWSFADWDAISEELATADSDVTDSVSYTGNVSATEIATLTWKLEDVTGSQEIANVTDFTRFGLDEPQISVVVVLADGTEHTLTIGDYNETASVYYLRLDESSSVYAIDSSLYSTFGEVNAVSLAEQETEEATTEDATEDVVEAVSELETEGITE